MKPLAFVASIAVLAAAQAAPAAVPFSLRYIGQQVIPTGTLYQGTNVGGLSGIEYAGNGSYLAISDDRSQNGNARFYTLDLGLTSAAFTGVTFTGVTTLRNPAGNPYPTLASDTESIRLLGNGNILYTSEGDVNNNINTFVREAKINGTYVRDLTIPAGQQQTGPSGATGVRNNLAYESLTISPDGLTAFVAPESALRQDGPIATGSAGSTSRITTIDLASGLPGTQFVYQIDAIPGAPGPGTSADNGLVELISLGGSQFLAMERSFVSGVGNNIRIYSVDASGATDVSSLASLMAGGYTPAAKELLLDLGTLGIRLDNVEGFTFGETLDNGARSLILASDNNFSTGQFTQFIAFEVQPVPEPATWAMMIAGFGLVGGTMRRRQPTVSMA